MQLVHDQEPRMLFSKLRAELPGSFTWLSVGVGPQLWRVQICRLDMVVPWAVLRDLWRSNRDALVSACEDAPDLAGDLLTIASRNSLNALQLGGQTLLPVVQGGMGVGLSAHKLAGSVAALGAMGTISSVDLRRHHPGALHAFARAEKPTLSAHWQSRFVEALRIGFVTAGRIQSATRKG
jgi:hypothetical protein